ncbi:MAG: PASTA domain-containing protein [Clostridiales bacterium]|nr:PASTA domain-containing protein [Clostridiales bacterium]
MSNKNYSIFSIQKRLLAIILLITFIFSLLIFRLCYIQIINAENLLKKGESQWIRDLPLNAKRGTIYDKNGVALAVSYTSYNIYVRAISVKDPSGVTKALTDVLNLNYETVYQKVTNRLVSESLIKLQVDSADVEKLKSYNLEGIYYSENNKRYYPYGDFLSQVLGYTTIDNIGQSGLELFYNKFLTGIDGYTYKQTSIRGEEILNTLDSYVPSISGNNLYLTIDYNIQKLAENACEEIMINEKPKSATIIVMDPNTGEILANTSKPSLDLNNLPRDNITMLNANSKNLSLVDVYEPGSTFKVLTTAMALEEGLTSPNDRFYDPGYRVVDGQKIRCWRLHGHGSQTMTEGLCNSCNAVFVDLALRLGEERLYSYFEKFGLGSSLNVDFPGESGGIIMNRETAQKVDLARMGFGQAIATTPMQLINAICSVVNGGTLLKPYYVNKITNSFDVTIKENTRTELNKVISNKTSDTIKMMFEEVIKKANGVNAFIPGYRVAGKTGTSQKYEDGKINGKYVSSFVGGFPADNPEYICLVVVDEPSSGAYYGSIVATPYAKKVFEGIIKYKQISPTGDLESDLKLMEENITMPNLVGMSLSKAISTLTSLNLQYEIDGEGEFVLTQTPPPNTKVRERSIILLET